MVSQSLSSEQSNSNLMKRVRSSILSLSPLDCSAFGAHCILLDAALLSSRPALPCGCSVLPSSPARFIAFYILFPHHRHPHRFHASHSLPSRHQGSDLMAAQLHWARSRAAFSYHEHGSSSYLDRASSSSQDGSSYLDGTEDDLMIAQVLSEELSGGPDNALVKRLSHLSSIPHVPRINTSIPAYNDADYDHQRLLERLCEYGLHEQRMMGDGNCQFRAISDQMYRTPEKHKSVRKQVVRQLKRYKDWYQEYVPMKYKDYVKKMGRQGEWGDHVTLQAAADYFGLKIWLITSFRDTSCIQILPKTPVRMNDIFLSFWSEVHYNSLYQASVPLPQLKLKKKHWLF